MNVLLTSVGRRNYLVQYFRSALADVGGQTFGTDASPNAAGMSEVDHAVVVPRILDPDYPARILDICEAECIDLVVCLNDLDLIVLSKHRDAFEALEATPLFPSHDQVILCADKLRTYEELSVLGVDTPLTWGSVEAYLSSPPATERKRVIVKPRFGSSSIGIERVDDLTQLASAWARAEAAAAASVIGSMVDAAGSRVIIQEWLEGCEFGVDVANDLGGTFAGVAAKRKLSMRAGETDRAAMVDQEPFEELARSLSRLVGHRGNLDVDAFVQGERISVLELNPRFGGGYPFSHESGFDIVNALVAWRQGLAPSPEELRATPGLVFAKTDRIVRVDGAL